MKRLVKHQPERLDSVVGFACACGTSCNCDCNCKVYCTCTCTGSAENFRSQEATPEDQGFIEAREVIDSPTFNNVYSNLNRNISFMG